MTLAARRNRILEIDRTRATEHQRSVLARLEQGRGRIFTPYKVWIHSPRIAEGMEVIGTELNKSSSLSPAELEAAILATAVFWGSPFVIAAHVRHGLKAGLSRETVDGLLERRKVTVGDPRLQLVCDFVADALAGASIEDDAYDAYERGLGRRGIAELLATIGYYTAVALAMRLHEVRPAGE